MSTLDVSNNISSSLSDDTRSFSDKNHSLEEQDTDSISITSNSFSTYEFNSENETKQVYKRKKRSRSETQSNYDESESSYDQKNRYHRFNDRNESHHRCKRQAIHVNREFNIEEKSSKFIDNSKSNADRKINNKHITNKNKNNINVNNYTIELSSSQKEGYSKKQDYKLKNKNSSLDNQKDFMEDISDSQNNNENIDIINKSNKNSLKNIRNDNDNDNYDDIGNTRQLNKKKYNSSGVEKSRFWNIRNSSNPLRNYNNKIHPEASPSSKLNSQLINNTNGTSSSSNDNILNYTLNSNKKKFSLLKRHENKITKKKKKNIAAFAAAVNQTNLLLPNTKISVLHSLKKDKKFKKLGKSKVSSQGPSVHSKIHFPSPLSSNSTTMMSHSNSNNSTTSVPTDPNVSIRAIITTKEAGVIIGREGKNVTKIREESGAKVNVSEHVPGTLDRIITVAGDIDTVTKAFLLVSERIVIEFEKERRGLTGIPGFNGLTSINHNHKSIEKEAKEDPKENNKNDKSSKVIHKSNKTESKSKDQIMDSSSSIIDNDDDATVNNDELNYTEEEQDLNDTYSEAYSLDVTSHQENYNDENDDLQSFSEGLNHDDITKIMNTNITDNQENLNNYSENNYDNNSYDNNQDDENNSMMEDDVNTVVSTNDDQNEIKLDSIELTDITKRTTSSASINNDNEEFSPDKDQETKEGIQEMDDLEVQELFKREHLSLRILIPDTRMGSIIGKGGSKIKEIQDISGAYIIASEEILPNSTERTVIINGTVQAIKSAIYNIGIILRENPDRNLNTIYYKPMPLSFYQNSLSTLSYPVPFTPQIIPPNYAASSAPYPLPFYLNSSTTSTLPPQPNLSLPVGSFQPPSLPPPPPHSQYISKFQFSKHYHKTFKNNNTTNKPINSTNVSIDDNNNSNPGNNKNDNSNNKIHSSDNNGNKNNNNANNNIKNNNKNASKNNNSDNNQINNESNNELNAITNNKSNNSSGGSKNRNNNKSNNSSSGNKNRNNDNNINNVNINTNNNGKSNNNNNNSITKSNSKSNNKNSTKTSNKLSNNNNSSNKNNNSNNNKPENHKINSNSNSKIGPKNKSSSFSKFSTYGKSSNLNHHPNSHGGIHHFSKSYHETSNSLLLSSTPSIHNPLDLATSPPAIFQNMEMNMGIDMGMGVGMDAPSFSIHSYNMAVGMTNITGSPQTILPPSHLGDFRMLSPPLTPPPPSLSTPYNGNGNLGMPGSTNVPFIFGRRKNGINGSKGSNLHPPLPPNFNNYPLNGRNGIPNIPPFNPMNNILSNGAPNPNQSHLNPPPPPQVLSPYHIQVQQLYVPNELIGCVIGKQGDCIKRIRNTSGSQIKIAESNPNNTERLITITGNAETNHIAMSMILGRLENERNKLMKQQVQQHQQLSPSHSPSSSPSSVAQTSRHHH